MPELGQVKVMQLAPNYWLHWYTVKSVGLGVVGAFAAYLLGRQHGRR